MGLRLNLNRPFGDGRDNQYDPTDLAASRLRPGYGVVDEPLEVAWNEAFSGAPFDHNNDGVVGNNPGDSLARQLLARHLFVMMMTLEDSGSQIDFDGDPANNTSDETAEGLAQWAINVVDFRDPDSIMTAFECDRNPFDGWGVDGDLSTDEGGDRFVVWGCERPELLMTETIAFHDLRREDREDEHPSPPTDSASKIDPSGQDADADQDYDQRLRPRGAFFVELYNPWFGDSRNPAEFYHDNGGIQTPGVALNKVAPGTASPVWRMIFVDVTDNSRKDKPIQTTKDLHMNDDVDRSIYFANPGGINDSKDGQPYFTTLPVAVLKPGRYAVVGSVGQEDDSENPIVYRSLVGRRTTGDAFSIGRP